MANQTDPVEAKVQRLGEVLPGLVAPARAGLVLFGSRATGEARPDSDVDLLVVATDLNADLENRVRAFAAGLLDGYRVALSFETTARLTFFLEQGDPFVWTVMRKGRCIADPAGLVEPLQKTAETTELGSLENGKVGAYVAQKARFHLVKALHVIESLGPDVSLGAMTAAQAHCVRKAPHLSTAFYEQLDSWSGLGALLAQSAVDGGTRESLDALSRYGKSEEGGAGPSVRELAKQIEAVVKSLQSE